MKILKFGGTSVGSPTNMKQVASIVDGVPGQKIVVLSALSGTTNGLVKIGEFCAANDLANARDVSKDLKQRHLAFVSEIFDGGDTQATEQFVDEVFETIDDLISSKYSRQVSNMLLVQGEILSTRIFLDYYGQAHGSVTMVMAHDYMTLDEYAEPALDVTKRKLDSLLEGKDEEVIITQGYVARNSDGGMDNLRRGGSDYTATIVGAVLRAEEVQIWTDIDGMHNNDPRIVENTFALAQLSFEEASELAYFGAKVLHPHCIVPAQRAEVPVRIKNTMKPEADGTLISAERRPEAVKALAAKDNITAIKVKSSRMVMAYGFLKKVFEVFEKYRTPIDMITTSEIAVSLTIDNDEHLDEITEELRLYGNIEVDTNQTIICIVGDLIAERKGMGSAIFNALDDIPLRMISYGGSRNNISVLVKEEFKKPALIQLHQALF